MPGRISCPNCTKSYHSVPAYKRHASTDRLVQVQQLWKNVLTQSFVLQPSKVHLRKGAESVLLPMFI
ncbi:unnamed protein product [Acanthoscelides obtectus]|uniref:Uncharacterized protein n=1 Tax=Acanthoscelides obtectus TaxID=200917 RepID=A0A9P0K4I1_ACAOB|nr:unnamed protein product [Acanthoscelides obtectus]CAK1669645.1 hypothetical protein AOBTE_LOCUS27125 [Acanthoscelides obtectus]